MVMTNETQDLERAFDGAMMEVYRRALTEAHYNAARFFNMLHDHRGLGTARILLHAPHVSEGYTALHECGRLDLTVEALILQKKWYPLFSDQERQIARQRLAEYHFEGRE